jgi:predicted dehydrogenase
MNPIRVGVIGLGRMGQQHCRVYSTLRRVQLSGVHDVNAELGRSIAQRLDAPFFSRVEDLLKEVDAVSLVTPTPSHYDLAMMCLEHGVHLLVEKPITETLEQAEALTRAAEESGLVVQVGHIERFNPAYIEMKNVLEDLTVLAVNFRRLSAYAGSNTDVNVVLDLMIHDLDLVLELIGEEPTEIAAYGLTATGNAVDHVNVQLSFPSGPLVLLTASRLTEQKVRAIDVTAWEAYVEADLLHKSVDIHRRTIGQYLNHNKRGVKYRQESLLERILVPVVEPLFSELQHFIESVAEKRTPLVTPRDGMKALRLATQICEAAERRMIFARAGELSPGLSTSRDR